MDVIKIGSKLVNESLKPRWKAAIFICLVLAIFGTYFSEISLVGKVIDYLLPSYQIIW